MLIAAYIMLVGAAIALSTFALVPAILLGAVAAGVALRHELRWLASRRVRPPRVTVPPAPRAMPQREG